MILLIGGVRMIGGKGGGLQMTGVFVSKVFCESALLGIGWRRWLNVEVNVCLALDRCEDLAVAMPRPPLEEIVAGHS